VISEKERKKMFYQKNTIDNLLAVYCSPTLSGVKPASLVSCGNEFPRALEQYQRAFASRSICFLPIYTKNRQWLLLVYHQKLLQRQLIIPDVQKLLRLFDYPIQKNLSDLLSHLRRRLEQAETFPHEIGLFLGYPIEDVLGFIRWKGANYKWRGYWKVYGDVEKAKHTFALLNEISRAVIDKVEQGQTILEIFSVS